MTDRDIGRVIQEHDRITRDIAALTRRAEELENDFDKYAREVDERLQRHLHKQAPR